MIRAQIKYDPPKTISGFYCEWDVIDFDNKESFLDYIRCKPTYNTLDDSVHRRPGEIIINAIDMDTNEVVWGDAHYDYSKRRLFVDMDGTLAVWKSVDKFETLFEENYFRNLPPYQSVVDAIRKIIKDEPNIEVFVLSAYLSDSKYALQEKNEWLDRYLPEIDDNHRLFCICQEHNNKKEFVPGGIRTTDRLLDDYTNNLNDWEPPAIGLKLLNGINDTHKSWQGRRISRFDEVDAIKTSIVESCFEDEPEPEIDEDVDI